MLIDSDGELEKIFDDRLRISKISKGVLGDKTNRPKTNRPKGVQNSILPGEIELKDVETKQGLEIVKPYGESRPDFDFLLRNEKDELYFSYKDKLQPPRKEEVVEGDTTQMYLREIEKEFEKIRESHRKMLMTRSKILKMVEKEIVIAKREIEKEKNKEIKLLKNKIKEISASHPPELLQNYEKLELKYSEQTKEVEALRGDNADLRRQLDVMNEKYSKLKSFCKESVFQYKQNLDNLYLESLRNIKKKYSK